MRRGRKEGKGRNEREERKGMEEGLCKEGRREKGGREGGRGGRREGGREGGREGEREVLFFDRVFRVSVLFLSGFSSRYFERC